MKKIHSCLVIGGDMRQIYMAEALEQAGFEVSLYGFEHLEEGNAGRSDYADYYEALKGKDAVIFPLPLSRDNVSLNAPFAGEEILLADILHAVEGGQTVFGGMFGEREKQYLKHRGILAYDYFAREELTVRNAVATAEGVLQIVIEELPITVHGSHALVTGYGRTSKTVCTLLRALGAQVTVAARKQEDLAWARVEGMQGVFYEELPACAGAFDYVVNTVPALVLGRPVLEKLKADCLLVEIASAPGGIDVKTAGACGLKIVKASSLPGKVAPKTAGKIISDTIQNVIREGDG
ncbi:MAG: dipicolinate synthase subunit DpsA [Candidatus Fimivicinus sp.]|nr:dipicolinate synthase subunit DpsA [Oscillospiraceae bacterium]MDY5591616.1 dipicolinate synthase subunit DpsA [Candidatus Fimivicinus sp.]